MSSQLSSVSGSPGPTHHCTVPPSAVAHISPLLTWPGGYVGAGSCGFGLGSGRASVIPVLQANKSKTPSEHAAVAMLAWYPAAQDTRHDAESAIWVTPLPHTSNSAWSTEEGTLHGEGSHVKGTKLPCVQSAVAMLAVYPLLQATVHDSESAISIMPLPHTSAAALVTKGNEQRAARSGAGPVTAGGAGVATCGGARVVTGVVTTISGAVIGSGAVIACWVA